MASEKRLIYADDIYDAVERRYQVSSGIEHRCERDLLDLICSAPTVDAVEVVHGRWQYWADGLARCPVCGYEYTDYLECKNYCHNCGAVMDGERREGE